MRPEESADDREMAAASLTKHVLTYVTTRRATGEFGPRTAASAYSCLISLADMAGPDAKAVRLNRALVERWMGSLRNSPATKRRKLSQVRVFCRWMMAHGHIRRDPTFGIRGAIQPRPASRKMQTEWTDAIFDACADARDRCMVTLMYDLGLRCVEVSRIQVGDLDLQEMTVEVVGKFGHARTVPLTSTGARSIAGYLAEFPARAGPLIRSYQYGDRPLSPGYISRRVSMICTDAGVHRAAWDGWTGHALRHTMASELVDAGANLRDVATVTGHENLASLSRYVGRSSVKRIREVMEARGRGRGETDDSLDGIAAAALADLARS